MFDKLILLIKNRKKIIQNNLFGDVLCFYFLRITTSDRYIDNVVPKANKQVAKIHPKTKLFAYRGFSGNSLEHYIVQLGSVLAATSYPQSINDCP
ncbi:hypothetical protein [Nostoc sp. DSM 114160]